MAEAEQVAGDLQFVRQAVERRERAGAGSRTPLAIPVLWGFIVLAGCVWIDLSPRNCWIYWMIAPPIGFALSRLIGGRAAFALGEYDADEGKRMGLHWSSIFIGSVPVVLLALAGKLNGQAMGQLLILISGIVYYLGGVHFDRRWMLPGLVMMLGAGALTFSWPFAWTTLGVAIFLSLVVGFSFAGKKSHA